jgi:glycosyltransferase involved in cell wall biosynthesis
VLHSGGRGPGLARNLGWQAARSPLVAFADDDVVPTRGWLLAIRSAFGDPLVVGADGPIMTDDVSPVRALLPSTGPGVGATGNVAYRRDVLVRLQGFDEHLRHSEDVDLARRARTLGLFVHVEPMEVYHPPTPAGLGDFARVARDKAQAHWRFYAKHPELRPGASLRWAPTLVVARRWAGQLVRDRRYRSSPATLARALAIAVAQLSAVVWSALRDWRRLRP